MTSFLMVGHHWCSVGDFSVFQNGRQKTHMIAGVFPAS